MPNLFTDFAHLGPGGAATVQPPFTGMDWYQAYGNRHDADGGEGRLVSMYSFDASWDSWEMHPAGAELVICTAGAMMLVQEQEDGQHQRTTLAAGDYAVNPPGTWHTADVAPGESATAVFITAGIGTEHRPR
jgi:uncharacterized cupin superfamily protein